MITVRFPNGQAVQYNSANHVVRHAGGYTDLLTRKDGSWVAQVPNACIIEVVPPCRVYNALNGPSAIEAVAREVRLLKRRLPAPPKRRRKP